MMTISTLNFALIMFACVCVGCVPGRAGNVHSRHRKPERSLFGQVNRHRTFVLCDTTAHGKVKRFVWTLDFAALESYIDNPQVLTARVRRGIIAV